MCRQTNIWILYTGCPDEAHLVPDGACNYYARGLQMCLGSPVPPIVKFDIEKMRIAGSSQEMCKFCAQGKDIQGK